MLTEDEKKHIREEEVFRREVQQQLDAEKPPASIGNRLWSFMNSGFALWVLSSIVVGLFGWMYSNYQAHNIEQAQQRELKRKIINEMSHRATESLSVLVDARTKIDQRDPDSPRVIFLRISEMFDGKNKSNINSIYPEYRDRSFLSLIAELNSVVSEEDKKYLVKAQDVYFIDLRVASKDAAEFQADDDVEKRVEKSRKAIDTAGKVINGLVINLGRAAGATLPPWLGKGK
jgi:hypothetical protein